MSDTAVTLENQNALTPPTVAPTKAASAIRPDIKPLTSLRFLAAIVVILAHGRESFTCWRGVSEASTFGQAVTFFFVLSGFILTHVYYDLKYQREELKTFFQARVARIWPAHVLSLLLLVGLIPEVFKVRAGDWPRFLENFFLVQAWVPSWREFFSYNASSWSISCEFFFYIVFPVLLLGLKKRWYLPLLVTGCIVAALVTYGNCAHLPEFSATELSNQGITYIHPFSRVFDFCVGMLTARLWRDRFCKLNLSVPLASALEATALSLVCLIYMFSNPLRYLLEPWLGPAGAYWLQNSGPSLLGFAFLVTVFAMDRGIFSRILNHPAAVLLGDLSFPIYMLHGVFLTYLAINFPQQDSVAACTVFVIALLMASHIMFELFEKPLRSLLLKIGRKASSKPKKPYSKKFALIMGAELIAFISLIYFTLPGIHKISITEAEKLSANATVKNIGLAPYLICNAAEARKVGDKLQLTTVWESTKSEPVNFSVKAVVFSQSNEPLGSITYKQDGLNQRVKANTHWSEEVLISTDLNKASRVEISVLKNRRETLHSTDAKNAEFSFAVPVSK